MTENNSQAQEANTRQAAVLVAIILLAGIVFAPVASFDFVNLDDDSYVTANPIVQQGLTAQGVAWAFTTTSVSNWHPLTWLSHMIDCQVFGARPGPQHMMNLAIHELAAVALFLTLTRLTRTVWPSAFVAVLFAIHPLHVESVTWISERKDVLSGLSWMLALAAYAAYAERPNRLNYVFVSVFFVVGLLSKPMVVTLPFVLLLLDYWPLRRIDFAGNSDWLHAVRRVFIEKLPLMLLSAVSCAITLIAQHRGGAIASTATFSVGVRLENAVVSYVMYLVKMFVPIGLAAHYPHPGGSLPGWQVLAASAVLVAITAVSVLLMRRCPYLLVGWLWYLGTLVPVIGIVQTGSQAMADRYTYVPLIGGFIMLTWGLRDVGLRIFGSGESSLRTWCFAACAGAAIAVLSVITVFQVMHWRNSIALFEHALRVTEHNSKAHNNLGTALMDSRRYGEAAAHFSKAIEEAPNNTDALSNLGVALLLLGKNAEAESMFLEVLKRRPNDPTIETNLGVALLQQRKNDAARNHLMRAIELDPSCDKARQALALTEKAER